MGQTIERTLEQKRAIAEAIRVRQEQVQARRHKAEGGDGDAAE